MATESFGLGDNPSLLNTLLSGGAENFTSAVSAWQQIVDLMNEADSAEKKSIANQDALNDLLDDMVDAVKRKNKEEAAWQAKQIVLQTKLNALQEKGDKTKDKEIERLQKTLKLRKEAHEIEDKITKIKERYTDLLDAEKEKEKAIRDAKDTGKEFFARGDFKTGMEAYWAGGVKETLKSDLAESLAGVGKAIGQSLKNFMNGVNKDIEEIAGYKSAWETRLYGSNSSYKSLNDVVKNKVGVNAYVKESELMKKIDTAIDTGIAYNIEQRAFLGTISENIATTFDAFDSTLLNIVRIQQSDSTAARLGMEAALNSYLNNMFSNTEYLKNASDSVTQSLYEATSLMSSTESIGFEYQAQKWLGSLYSVGFSNVSSIAKALGELASGDISGTDSGAGKLLVMSAARAGLNYSDLLTKGIDESQMNVLMQSMVEYLQEIADSNKVVQSQYAAIFGLTTSDIKAAGNLVGSVNAIKGNMLNYGGALGTLSNMAGSIGSRVSLAEVLQNLSDNFQYRIAEGVANNPVLYSLWTVSNALEDLTGGINLPFVSALGSGVDLNATVASLMKVGAMAGPTLMGIGSLISGVAGAASGKGLNGILNSLGVNQVTTVSRGKGLGGGRSTTPEVSQYSYIGNQNSEDTLNAEYGNAEQQKVEAAGDTSDQIDTKDIYDEVKLIYDLFNAIVENGALNVRQKGFGLLGGLN